MPDYNDHLFQINLKYQLTTSFNQRMSYPIAKGGGGTHQRDDQEDPLVPGVTVVPF